MFSRGALLYIGQRLLLIVFTAVAVSSIVFLGVHQLPGDALLNERRPDPAAERELLHYYHLDLPLGQQYVLFVTGVVHGDLGESLVNRGVKITPLLLREARVSLEVGAAAIVFTIGLGVLLGMIAAVRQNTWIDYLASTTSVIGYSMPNFVIASLLFLLFGVLFYNWTGGAIYYNSGWTGSWGTFDQILIPAFALGFPYASIIARLTRASMLEVLRQDYVRTARAKGLTDRIVIIRHALRNALIPVVTIMGPLVIYIITGSVVIENIFGIPGLGKEFATSILQRDYNIVIGLFTFYAILIALANLLVDLLYTVIDPEDPLLMATAPGLATPQEYAGDTLAREQTSLWGDAWRRLRRNRLALVATIFLLFMTLVAIVAQFWTPYSYFAQGLGPVYQGPTAQHLLGLDDAGRDILSRIMVGAGVSLRVGVGTSVVIILVGVTIGLIAGYYRGLIDGVISTLINITYGIPSLLVALILVLLLGRSLAIIIFAIAIINWNDMARLVRGQALALREREFVEAARSGGARVNRIIFRHILPNALGPIIVQATFVVPQAILFEAFLSFLGLGVPPPTPSWGGMAADGFHAIRISPHIVLAPSIALSLTLMAFNFLGDGLRDALDPRQKR